MKKHHSEAQDPEDAFLPRYKMVETVQIAISLFGSSVSEDSEYYYEVIKKPYSALPADERTL